MTENPSDYDPLDPKSVYLAQQAAQPPENKGWFQKLSDAINQNAIISFLVFVGFMVAFIIWGTGVDHGWWPQL